MVNLFHHGFLFHLICETGVHLLLNKPFSKYSRVIKVDTNEIHPLSQIRNVNLGMIVGFNQSSLHIGYGNAANICIRLLNMNR